MSKAHASPHRRALTAAGAHIVQVIDLVVFQLLIRVIALSPLLYAAVTGEFPVPAPLRGHELAFSLLCCLPLYVLIVLPFRFQGAAEMAVMHGIARETRVTSGRYGKWLLAALVRLLLALPFILPLMAFLGAYYYFMRLNVVEAFNLLDQAAGWFGGSYLAAVAAVTGAGLLSALLGAWGWKRGLPFEHREIQGRTLLHSLREAGAVRRQRRRYFRRTVHRNFLLTLPALLGVGFALFMHFSSTWTGAIQFDFINVSLTLLTFSIPAGAMAFIGAALLILWAPLLPLRKLALCAVLAPAPRDEGTPRAG